MSEENVEIARQPYAAYNAAFSAPHPREALRAALERHADPEIEWEVDPLRPVALDAARIYHGIDGVMELFELILEAFEGFRQVPERFIECGDRVLVFVRSEARGRIAGLDVNEEWAHLVTVCDGKLVRVQNFRDREAGLEAAGLRE